jgi:V/A-type H+-transporting ATPase subunit A
MNGEYMTASRKGRITKISGNMVTVSFGSPVMQNEVAYILHANERLKSEIIRVRGNLAEMQVYEATDGLKIGETVEFTGELLSVELGPGMLGQIFDGLQNPLPEIARQCGFFLKRGVYSKALSDTQEWDFTPIVKPGDKVRAGIKIGYVAEKLFKHYCMVPFALRGSFEVVSIENAGRFTIREAVAQIKDPDGKVYPLYLTQNWPVKIPIGAYAEKLKPGEPLVTRMRLIDSLFPVARGGTY